MIDFLKHSKLLPFIAYKLNIYPAAFDVDEFIDVDIYYSTYCKRANINFYYKSLKCRGFFVYRDDFVEEVKEGDRYRITLRNVDMIFALYTSDIEYRHLWSDLPKLTYFWHDFINDSFFKRITT